MASRSYKSNGISNHHNPKSLNKAIIGDFRIGAKLGQGTFSTVCQGTHIPTGEKVAIKIMSKDQIKEKSDKIRIEKEINIQKKLHHQNIVQQYAIIETDSTIYIISEYCSGGELFDYIVSKRKLYEVEACRIYQQLISGLEYLHKQRICHRDLKPENLLFDSKHILKIADFGLSNDYHKGKLTTPCGSPCYAAPEMVTGKKYTGSSVDIWSSGIVLYTMVCGFLPFEDDNQNILFGKIAKGLFSLPSFLSQSCKDLLKKILVTDPKKRYGFEEIKHHSWFMSVNNVMGKNIFFNSPGVFVDEDVLPIDVEIVAEIYNDFHIDIIKIVNDVLRNRHNKITTTYYLILKRKIRNNESSVSDISSNSTNFIKYIKSSISKMGYWDNDYEKITAHYVKLVKKFLNFISEENSISTDSRHKINSNRNIQKNGNNASSKGNNNNSPLKTAEANKEKMNLTKLSNTNNQGDYRVYTEMNDSLTSNKNKNAKNKINNILNNDNNRTSLNNPVQNGGMDIRIGTFYDERNTLSTKPYVDTKNDTEEPIAQKINESYKPKISIQEFLQTDANNIKMNERLFKNSVELNNENNFNKLNKNNINVLKSEESTNKEDNNKYNEPKETTLPTVERILLTEVNNIGINSLHNNLLNKNKDLNFNDNDINNNYSKDIPNDNDNDSIRNERMNTLYNKDDSDEKLITIKNDNNNTINDNNIMKTEIIKMNNNQIIKRSSLNNKEYNHNNINNSKPINNNLLKAINGLNEQNYNNNSKNKSVEKMDDNSNKMKNSKINNKNYNNNNKDKGNKFLLNIPNNQIYKKISTYSEKQERIMKFINQKNSLIPKTKEDSKRESKNYNLDLENGKFLYNNQKKYKYKNRYSQESNFANKYIHNITLNVTIKPNGSNEMSYINKIIYGNNNDAMHTKKKKKPKSIDDKDYRINKKFYMKESNKINNSFIQKENNNNGFYSKIKNINQNAIYKDIYNDKKYLDESYIDAFRYRNTNYIQNMNKYNKKIEIPDFNNTSHAINRANNNYFIEKMKNNEKYNALFNNNLNNYTNLLINKNHRLHEHNSFDLPKNIKNKLKKNRLNCSMEKINKNQNNNNIINQYNKNYNKINKKMNFYFRNTSNKPNSSITQYYGINNYNFDKYEKFSNEKMLTNQNQRMGNYKGYKFKSNSVDMNTSKSKNNNLNVKSKNKRKFYLNTSVIKDKTPKKLLFTSFFLDKNKHNYNQYKKNFILNTLESTYTNSSNANNIFKNNIDDVRYLTLRDNDNLSNSSRKSKFHNYFFPKHKRYNFSQEPEKKRKESEALDIFSPFGKGNSFVVSNTKKNNFLFNNKDKKIHKFAFPNLKNLSQFNKNVIYEKQLFITNSNNKDNKINGKNGNINNIKCKRSVDNIKEIVERIVGHKVNLITIKNPPIKNLECKYIEGSNAINFILNINKNQGQNDYVTISPTLIVGNENTYKQVIEKIRNKLI